MKVNLSPETRAHIIEMVLENREDYNEMDGSIWLLNTCPFLLSCDVCQGIFPKWARDKKKSKHKCPCGSMGTSYVGRRMRLLFPELY